MLVLSRKVNEKIVIDGGIVVTVVKIEGGQVRLGIERPQISRSSGRRFWARRHGRQPTKPWLRQAFKRKPPSGSCPGTVFPAWTNSRMDRISHRSR